MPDEILEEFPFDETPKPKAKQTKKPEAKPKAKAKSKSPLDELDQFPMDDVIDTTSDEVQEAIAVKVPEPVEEEEVEIEPETRDELDAFKVEEETTPWQQFLLDLPADLLHVLGDLGIKTQEALLAKTAKELLLPTGKMTQPQVTQLQAALKAAGWSLAEPPPVKQLDPPKPAATPAPAAMAMPATPTCGGTPVPAKTQTTMTKSESADAARRKRNEAMRKPRGVQL